MLVVLFSEYRAIKKRSKSKDKRSQLEVAKLDHEAGSLTIQRANLVPFSVELHPNVISPSDAVSLKTTAEDDNMSPPKSPTSSTSTSQQSATLKRSKSMPKRRTSFRGQECAPS